MTELLIGRKQVVQPELLPSRPSMLFRMLKKLVDS
jgi:hypothetical protein